MYHLPRIMTGALFITILSSTAMPAARYETMPIKAKLGKLVTLMISSNNELHPRTALRLIIYLLQQYCTIDPKPKVLKLCASLQGLLQENDAKKILITFKTYGAADILPDEIIKRIEKMSILEQKDLIQKLNKQLLLTEPSRSVAIHEIEQRLFQQSL